MYSGNSYYNDELNSAWNSIKDKEQLKGKTVLIAGATGQIGTFLTDMLLWADKNANADVKVVALVRDVQKAKERFEQCDELEIVKGDVTEPLSITQSPDYIIHLAGDGYPEAFRVRPVETMTPAIIGTVNLLELAREKKVQRLLYASSGEVYGVAEGKPEGFRENDYGIIDSVSVRSCYPMAKKTAETLCVSYAAEYGVDVVITRLSHVYGPCIHSKDNRATTQFINAGLMGEDIVLQSLGTQMRSFTYVKDAVTGMVTALLCGNSSESYNVADTKSAVTIADFADLVAKATGIKVRFQRDDFEKTPISFAVLNSDKLKELGWSGHTLAEDGIGRTIKIMKD